LIPGFTWVAIGVFLCFVKELLGWTIIATLGFGMGFEPFKSKVNNAGYYENCDKYPLNHKSKGNSDFFLFAIQLA
jgi:hypothetical protein